MIATSAEICNRDISNEEILTRVEHKLDHIIEILEDKTLTLEEEKLIRETDIFIQERKFDEFVSL